MSKHYAMIVGDRVIDVLLNQENEPHWPPVPGGTHVVAVECDETVERDMIYNVDTGEFSTYIYSDNMEPEPTQLDRIEAIVSEDREFAINEALDAYTLELMNEGVI